jgi:hypothetical protein
MNSSNTPSDTQASSDESTVVLGARQLFGGSAYGPENLKVIGQAFDQAWQAIAPLVDDNVLAHEAARLKLANMILSVASSEKLDPLHAKSVVLDTGAKAGDANSG